MKKKIIDGRGMLFGKVSVIDILVVLVAIALAAAVYARFFTAADVTAVHREDEKFVYEVRLNAIRDFSAKMVRPGDVLYANDGGVCLGTVTDTRLEPATKGVERADGEIVITETPGRYCLIVTVEATGLITNGQYYASRTYELGANGNVYFHTRYVNGTGIVWSIGPAGER